jgi:Protein of unknown function (DUF3551)
MRFAPTILAAAAIVTLTYTPVFATDQPHDPYRWCAVYGAKSGGATNCGFVTLAQCRATVSGIGGMCQPNPFYNPGKARRSRR